MLLNGILPTLNQSRAIETTHKEWHRLAASCIKPTGHPDLFPFAFIQFLEATCKPSVDPTQTAPGSGAQSEAGTSRSSCHLPKAFIETNSGRPTHLRATPALLLCCSIAVMLLEPASLVHMLAKLLPVASLQGWAAWVFITFKLDYLFQREL